ncbi:MAG: hypothetical protein KF894_18345 [Labilithrix sp.]|nr:hypothetical protein [Labilithrix sp.]
MIHAFVLGAVGTCAVVMVGDGSSFSNRVLGELASSVACVDVTTDDAPEESRTKVRVVTRRRTEIWDRGALTKVLMLEGKDEVVDAVKVAEHVRARLIAPAPSDASTPSQPTASRDEVGRAPTSADALAAPRSADAPAAQSGEPTRSRLAFAGGIGPTLDAGAVGLGARVAVRSRVSGVFGAGAMVVAPLVAATIRGNESDVDAEVSTIACGPVVDVELRVPRTSLTGSVGLAALLTYTRATGFANPLFRVRRDGESRFTPTLTASAAYFVQPHLAFELAGGLGVSVPDIEIRFDGRSVARWGMPYVFSSGGIRIAF